MLDVYYDALQLTLTYGHCFLLGGQSHESFSLATTRHLQLRVTVGFH